MADETQDLTEEELEAQRAQPLPDREAMSIIDGGIGRPMPFDGLPETGGPTVEYSPDDPPAV